MRNDITMCTGKGCKTKRTCYRFTKKPDEYYQSWFMESPIKDGGCEWYINKNK